MAISKASTSTLSNGLEKLKSLKTLTTLPVRTGLIMWYDASNTASLTLSGSNVIEWRDLSGNGRHASGGSSPQYISNSGLNGLPAIDFGTDSQYRLIIANPVTFASKNCHFFAVAKSRKESPTDYSAIIGAYASTQPASTGALAWSFPGAGNVGGTQQFLNSSRAWGTAANRSDYLSSNFYNINAAMVSGTSTFRSSRIDDGSNGSLSAEISFTTNALGHQEGNVYGGNVTIAELICFGYKLPDSDRDKVENYLFDKWGV
jgi:hypothetical protein